MTATTEVACSSSKVADLTTSGSGCDSAQLLPSNEATAASAEIDKSLDPLLGLGMADDHNTKSNDKTEAAQQDSGSIEPPASVVKFNRESIGGNEPLQGKQNDTLCSEDLSSNAPYQPNRSLAAGRLARMGMQCETRSCMKNLQSARPLLPTYPRI